MAETEQVTQLTQRVENPRAALCIGISHLFSGSGRDPASSERARQVAAALTARQWQTTLVTDEFQTVADISDTAARSSRKGILTALRKIREQTWTHGIRDIIIYFSGTTLSAGMEGWDRDITGGVAPEEIEDILRGVYPNTRLTIFSDAPFEMGLRLPIQMPCDADAGNADPRLFWPCAMITLWSPELRLAELLCRERLPQAVADALRKGTNIQLCYSSVPRIRRILEREVRGEGRAGN